MRIKLYQPIIFDGKTLEGEIDTDETPVNGESIIQRGWGEVVDAESSIKPKPTKPALELTVEPATSASQAAEPVAVEPEVKSTKTRKGK